MSSWPWYSHPPGTPSAGPESGVRGPGSAVRFLFLDDEPDFLESVHDFLTANMPELEVYCALTPSAALLLCRTVPIDVAFVDYRLPEMDGVDFVREAAHLLPGARFVIITGHPAVVPDVLAVPGVALHGVLLKPLATAPFLNQIRAVAAIVRQGRAGKPGRP